MKRVASRAALLRGRRRSFIVVASLGGSLRETVGAPLERALDEGAAAACLDEYDADARLDHFRRLKRCVGEARDALGAALVADPRTPALHARAFGAGLGGRACCRPKSPARGLVKMEITTYTPRLDQGPHCQGHHRQASARIQAGDDGYVARGSRLRNTGIGLAMLRRQGLWLLRRRRRMPADASATRYMIVRQFGAEEDPDNTEKHLPLVLKACNDLVSSDPSSYFGANRSTAEHAPIFSHYAPQRRVVQRPPSSADDGVAPSPSFSSTGRYVKEQKPSATCVGIEPTNARVHVGAKPAPHTIVGIGLHSDPSSRAEAQRRQHDAGLSEDTLRRGQRRRWAHATPAEAIECARGRCATDRVRSAPSAGAAPRGQLEIGVPDEAARARRSSPSSRRTALVHDVGPQRVGNSRSAGAAEHGQGQASRPHGTERALLAPPPHYLALRAARRRRSRAASRAGHRLDSAAFSLFASEAAPAGAQHTLRFAAAGSTPPTTI